MITSADVSGPKRRALYDLLKEAKEVKGQRLGQAFFNALPSEYQDMVRGTDYDPFYDSGRVFDCIEYISTTTYRRVSPEGESKA